jgi:hypothetical protein
MDWTKLNDGCAWADNTERYEWALISGGPPSIPTDNGLCRTRDNTSNNSGLWIFFRVPFPNPDDVTDVRNLARSLGFDTTGTRALRPLSAPHPLTPTPHVRSVEPGRTPRLQLHDPDHPLSAQAAHMLVSTCVCVCVCVCGRGRAGGTRAPTSVCAIYTLWSCFENVIGIIRRNIRQSRAAGSKPPHAALSLCHRRVCVLCLAMDSSTMETVPLEEVVVANGHGDHAGANGHSAAKLETQASSVPLTGNGHAALDKGHRYSSATLTSTAHVPHVYTQRDV